MSKNRWAVTTVTLEKESVGWKDGPRGVMARVTLRGGRCRWTVFDGVSGGPNRLVKEGEVRSKGKAMLIAARWYKTVCDTLVR